MNQKLEGKLVVLTGASSGLGRSAAVAFARAGASLVLSARRRDALEETAALCRQVGPSPEVVVADVTRESEVVELQRAALALRGRIDVWVNNAGVTAFGLLDQAPLEELRRVLETNLWGAIYGARAVVPVFKRQGQGVLVNVGSILSKVGQPFVPAYVISKFALRGLTEALRAELANHPRIHVCTLLPYAIDTPHFDVAPNVLGRKAHPMPPTQTPELVAEALVDLVRHPRRELHVPRSAWVGLALHALFPRTVERVIHDSLRRWHFGAGQALDAAGNLWQPPKQPASTHGRDAPRVTLPGLIAWLLGHYGARGIRGLLSR